MRRSKKQEARSKKAANVSRGTAPWLFFWLLASGCWLLLPAAIVDQIAVVVGNTCITASQIDREIRLSAFVNEQKPDPSPASKYKAADRLIDQTLVHQEMDASRYPVPDPGSEATEFDQIQSRFGSQSAFRAKLAEYGLSEDDLKAFLLWQLAFVEFVDVRFRPGVQVQEDQIRAYFEKQGLPAADYPKLRDQIQRTLTAGQVDKALDAWLKDARSRTKIEFRKEAFE